MTNPEGPLPQHVVALLDEIGVVFPPATSPDDYISIDFGAAHILDKKIASLGDSMPTEVIEWIKIVQQRAYDAAMATDFPTSSKWMEDVI